MQTSIKLISFFEDLAVLLRSGTDLNEALGVMAVSESSDKFNAVVLDLKNHVQNGTLLSGACENHPTEFNPYSIGMIKNGEASGRLAEALQSLAGQLNKERELAAQITTALIYPTILLVAMLLSAIVIVGLVLPQFTALFESFGSELSPAGQILLGIGNFVNAWGRLLLLSLVFLIALAWSFREHWQLGAKAKQWAVRLPWFGKLMHQIDFARFSSSFASLLENGVSQTEALKIASGGFSIEKNRDDMLALAEQIKQGESLSNGLASFTNIDSVFMQSISNSERAGQLPETLHILSSRLEKEFSQSAQRFALLIEPALIVVIGLFIGLLIYTVFSTLNGISAPPI